MGVRAFIESAYPGQTETFAGTELLSPLQSGQAGRALHDKLPDHVCRTHLKSPTISALLFAITPPKPTDTIKHNISAKTPRGAGFSDDKIAEHEREKICLFAGVFSVKPMLSKIAGRMGRLFNKHLGLPQQSLNLFRYYPGPNTLRDYTGNYECSDDEVGTTTGVVVSEKIFIKRYMANQ